jgi:DNA-binding NarL/FixJ family response regulator
MIGDRRRQGLCEQALTLARAAKDEWNIAWALSQIGFHVYEERELEIAALEDSLALFRRLEDPMGLSHTLVRRAWRVIDEQQNFDHARSLLKEAGAIADEAGDKVVSAWIFFNLGRVSWLHEKDFLQARRCFQRSLALFREARFQSGTTLRQLAAVEQALGNLEYAQKYYIEAVVFDGYRSGSHPVGLAGLASIARAQGQLVRAATLLGTVNASEMPYMLKHYPEIVTYESDVAFVREQLGADAFAEAWTVGHAMTPAQIVSYVIESRTEASAMASSPHAPETTPPAEVLTRRELDILRLVADGYSNAEIADQLVLALSTVKWYVSEILRKLDVANRTQAVIRARTLGILG